MIESQSHIVITGAGQGIGRALARHFARANHKLFLIDINEENLKHTVDHHLSSHTSNISYSKCDLSSTSAIRDTIHSHAAPFLGNKIDFLINNAGISYPYWPDNHTMADEETLDQWKAYIDVNLTGTFAMSQACIPHMRTKSKESSQKLPGSKVGTAGPCILIVSSFRALISDPNQEGYAATKAGVLGLCTAMAVSMSQFGIRVNAVSPGRVKVGHESKQGEEEGKEWKHEANDEESHLTNRAGMPEDITEAVEYMLGAGFVTGQNLVVDGGKTVMK